MNVLPRILYFFRTIPVALVRSDLMVFQKKLLQLIWGDKRPRMNKCTLYTPKQKGGLGLPDLLKYFHAAQLAQLTKFNSQKPHTLLIESYSFQFKPISHIMWLPTRDRPQILCPSLSLSLGIWDRLSKSHNFKLPHTPISSSPANQGLHPGPHSPCF